MAENTTSFPWGHMTGPGKIYGTATVGERGQISIPADARKELNINSGDKIIVFGNRVNGALILFKADVFEHFADFFMTKLDKLGEHAHTFFEQFTSEAAGESSDEPGDTAKS